MNVTVQPDLLADAEQLADEVIPPIQFDGLGVVRPRKGAEPDFWEESPETVLFTEQPQTAVYWNARGQIVIRQERSPLEDEDHFVYFAPHNIDGLIRALQETFRERES